MIHTVKNNLPVPNYKPDKLNEIFARLFKNLDQKIKDLDTKFSIMLHQLGTTMDNKLEILRKNIGKLKSHYYL